MGYDTTSTLEIVDKFPNRKAMRGFIREFPKHEWYLIGLFHE